MGFSPCGNSNFLPDIICGTASRLVCIRRVLIPWFALNFIPRTLEAPPLSQDWYMRRGRARNVPGEARVGGDFDGALVGHEPKLHVESQRCRMVGATSVQPDSLRMVLPCQWEAMREKGTPGALADKRGCYAKERQLNVRKAATVELKQTLVGASVRQREDVNRGIVKN